MPSKKLTVSLLVYHKRVQIGHFEFFASFAFRNLTQRRKGLRKDRKGYFQTGSSIAAVWKMQRRKRRRESSGERLSPGFYLLPTILCIGIPFVVIPVPFVGFCVIFFVGFCVPVPVVVVPIPFDFPVCWNLF